MPGRDELPGTLKRSPKKAQKTFIKAHDAAVKEYGDIESYLRDGLKLGTAERAALKDRYLQA